jgi:acyl-CoA synthetase (AMP-forming)/AMP-acid ligase II
MPSSMLAHLEAWAAASPHDVAAEQDDVSWSISTLLAESRRLAYGLHQRGVGAGDRVAWWGGSSLDFAALLLAVWRLDATYVGIHPRYTEREVLGVLDRVRPRVVVHESAVSVVTTLASTFHDATAFCRMDALLATDVLVGTLTPTAPALIVFTTGSTGSPKAAVISHRAVAAASSSQAMATDRGATCTINALPANHIGGLVNITTATWWARASVVFVPVFSPEAVVAVLRRQSAVRLGAVPMLFRRCLDEPSFADAARGVFLHALSGGAPLPRAVYESLTALGVQVQGMYGQTEMAGSACFTSASDDAATTCETIGRPHGAIEVRIDQASELQVRGAQLFDGYLDDAEATASAMTADGWLRSGDLAVRRPDGTLQLTGRLKDVINTRGYKVMPREVEDVLLDHPRVASAAVMGLANDVVGESIVAFLTVRDAGTLKLDEIREWCQSRLVHYKVPQQVIVLSAMPLLGVGKIDRRRLADELSRGVHG